MNVPQYAANVGKITDLRQDLARGLDFVGWTNEVKRDSVVFVKPNFTFYEYREGITTTPDLLRALLFMLTSRAKKVIVGESNGGNNSFTADKAFDGHAMREICKETGAELVNLSNLPSTYVQEKINGIKVEVQLPNLLLNDVDCFVSVPVLKVHAMTGVTLSMKNLWGCYPDTMRCLHHGNLSEKLTLITKMVKPKLIVIDGKYALDNHGPMFGTPKRTDLLITANNPVLSDALGAALMGIPLEKAKHILVAENEGLGITDLAQARISDGWEDHRMQFNVQRTMLDNLSSLLFKSEALARLVMASPLTPAIYGIAGRFRTADEQKVVSEIEDNKCEYSK